MIKKYTKKDGSTAYMFVAYLGIDPITGKQKRTTRRGFKTKREATIAEARLQTDIQENGFGKAPKKITFREVYEEWIEQHSLVIRASSLNVIKSIISKGILSEMEFMKVANITRRDAQRLVKHWHSKYKSYRTYKSYATTIMDYAVEEEYISTNPFSKVKTPKAVEDNEVQDDTLKYYTKDELKTFLDFIKDDIMYYAIFRTLAFTGIRKGELMALQWKDIDFTENTLSINKTVACGYKSRQFIGPPKTKSSIRTIRLDQGTVSALNRWKFEQRKQLLSWGFNANNETQLMFIEPLTNHLLSKVNLTQKLSSICEINEFKRINLHGFRHTCCSLLFEAGISVKEVQCILGHSNIKTTLDIYAHVTATQKDTAVEKLSAYIGF